MRVDQEKEIKKLLRKNLRESHAAKRAAESSRTMLFWLTLTGWIKTGFFLILFIAAVVSGFSFYSRWKERIASYAPKIEFLGETIDIGKSFSVDIEEVEQ